MAIPIDGMVGYIRTRPKRNAAPAPGAAPELELYIDPQVILTPGAAGVQVGKPADCVGILYSVPGGKLEVRYPE